MLVAAFRRSEGSSLASVAGMAELSLKTRADMAAALHQRVTGLLAKLELVDAALPDLTLEVRVPQRATGP